MKALGLIASIFFLCLFLVVEGCESVAVYPGRTELPPKTDSSSNLLSGNSLYAPAKIDIMPLTEFVYASDAEEASKIKVYVSLLDWFGCQVKSPAVFRFELYQRVIRSAEPKGKRIVIWPDIDLIGPSENNKHWRDFLRAYEFNLDFEPEGNQSYILQATCLCPNGKRLSADFVLKHAD